MNNSHRRFEQRADSTLVGLERKDSFLMCTDDSPMGAELGKKKHRRESRCGWVGRYYFAFHITWALRWRGDGRFRIRPECAWWSGACIFAWC